MLKQCPECSQDKELSEFYKKTRYYKYPNSPAGVSNLCKECDKAARKRYLDQNPEVKTLTDRKYHLKRYGLTVESYNSLFLKQNGCCAGCNLHQSEFNRNFAVDHCHTTGKVRGLLCVACNLVIGHAQDDTSILLNLIKYLNNHKPELADNTNVVDLKSAKKVG